MLAVTTKRLGRVCSKKGWTTCAQSEKGITVGRVNRTVWIYGHRGPMEKVEKEGLPTLSLRSLQFQRMILARVGTR